MTDQDLYKLEQRALTGDRDAIQRVISLERKLRAAIRRTLDGSNRLNRLYTDAMEET